MSYPRSQTPARIVALLRERGPMLRQEIASALGVAASGLNAHLELLPHLLESERMHALPRAPVLVRLRGDAREHRVVPPPPPPSGTRLVRGLPVLREGPGDRDETCVEYAGCLTRFTRHSIATRAHCPETCTERRRVDWRIERDEHAGRRDASAMSF